MKANNTIPLEAGHYYHIYNHANGRDNVFYTEENYRYFIKKYKEYKKIISENHLRDTLVYIHNNPCHHGFVVSLENWEYSSFHYFLGNKATFLLRDEAKAWFDTLDNFLFCHQNYSSELTEMV